MFNALIMVGIFIVFIVIIFIMSMFNEYSESKTAEGFSDPRVIEISEKMMNINMEEGFNNFKNKYPEGDAVLYYDLLKLKMENKFTKDNVKKKVMSWL